MSNVNLLKSTILMQRNKNESVALMSLESVRRHFQASLSVHGECSDFDYIRMDMSEQHANVRDSPSHTVT